MLKTLLSKVNNPRQTNPLGDKEAPETNRRPDPSGQIHGLAETLCAQAIHAAQSGKRGGA
jgi:hypothetical protein